MADLDLAELRRLASELNGRNGLYVPMDPTVVLQLLDRLEAAEARVVELVNELDDERVAYAELIAAVPGAVAGEPAAHTYLVGTNRRHIHDGAAPHHGEHRGLCGGWFLTATAVAAAYPSPEQRLAELARLPVCRRCAPVVAGEPESTPAAERYVAAKGPQWAVRPHRLLRPPSERRSPGDGSAPESGATP